MVLGYKAEVIAQEIVEDLTAALAQFAAVAITLEVSPGRTGTQDTALSRPQTVASSPSWRSWGVWGGGECAPRAPPRPCRVFWAIRWTVPRLR